MQKKRHLLGLRLSALLEMILFFLLLFLLGWWTGEKTNFYYISPHPYWVIVVLISVQYGTKEGIAAALLACLCYFIGWLPRQTLDQDKYDYLLTIGKTPLLWLITSVVVGELRCRHIRERNALFTIAQEAEEKQQALSSSYNALKKTKERLEMRFVTETKTALASYRAFKELEIADKSQVIEGAIHLVHAILACEACSIYLLDKDCLVMTVSDGEEQERLAATLCSSSPLFEEIVGKRRTLSIIHSSDQQIMTENNCVAACPIIAKAHGTIYGMIKIDKIAFLQLSFSTVESLRMVGEWVGTAYENALAKEEAEQQRFISKNSALLTKSFFSYQKQFLSHLARRLNIDVTLLTISLSDEEELVEENEKGDVLKKFKETVEEGLRAIDQLFELDGDSLSIALLLINTSLEGAETVRQKIAAKLAKSLPRPMRFTYKLSSIYTRDSTKTESSASTCVNCSYGPQIHDK